MTLWRKVSRCALRYLGRRCVLAEGHQGECSLNPEPDTVVSADAVFLEAR